jgi:hypothetical protein
MDGSYNTAGKSARAKTWSKCENQVCGVGSILLDRLAAGFRGQAAGGRRRMIARVRIAPIERWCPSGLSLERGLAKHGPIVVDIITESMTDGYRCNGRMWEITPDSANKIRALNGKPPDQPGVRRGLCEHMLELD